MTWLSRADIASIPTKLPIQALAAGEMRTSLISFSKLALHHLDEPALTLLKAATLALLNE
jgi:hypothetical protein